LIRPLLIACVLSISVPAFAAAPSDEATVEAAKTRYSEGSKLYAKKRYEDARVAFLQSIHLNKRPAAMLMLARTSIKLERWADAHRELEAYLSEVGDVPANVRDVVEAARAEVQSHIGKIRLDVPKGAEVTVDGERVTSFDAPIVVAAGTHKVVVLHREETRTETVDVAVSGTTTVKPSFAPKPMIPAADTRTRPTPAAPPMPAREHEEESTSILAPPETTWPVYVAGAVGLGGLAAAAIFGGLSANSDHAAAVANETLVRTGKSRATCEASQVEAAYVDTCLSLLDNEKLADQHRGMFETALIVGGAGMVLAAGWFFFAPKEKKTSSSAYVVPGLGGASLQGRF
jgi:hypothetical protein